MNLWLIVEESREKNSKDHREMRPPEAPIEFAHLPLTLPLIQREPNTRELAEDSLVSWRNSILGLCVETSFLTALFFSFFPNPLIFHEIKLNMRFKEKQNLREKEELWRAQLDSEETRGSSSGIWGIWDSSLASSSKLHRWSTIFCFPSSKTRPKSEQTSQVCSASRLIASFRHCISLSEIVNSVSPIVKFLLP